MRVVYTRHFVRMFEGYNKAEQEMIYNALREILKYIKTGQAAHGLRIKKLHKRIYEARVTIALRLAYFKEKNAIKFFCVGNHNDIARCLKRLRQLL